jgi:hypothetical protein
MKTTDLFKTSAKKLNESLAKTFGQKLNLESFDTPKLEDARNKLRTQIHTARTEGGFNENIENEALSQAQFMHDAIVAEIMDRAEHIVGTVEEEGVDDLRSAVLSAIQNIYNGARAGEDMIDDVADELGDYFNDVKRSKDQTLRQAYQFMRQEGANAEGDPEMMAQAAKQAIDMLSQQGVEQGMEEGDMNRAAKGNEKYGKDGMKALAKAGREGASEKKLDTIRDKHDKYDESIEQTGDNMRNLREGEIQQASAIVTAKTMVDRVGRWIEELSGMENDTLLTLGDSIRDEMGQEAAKNFISACAPAIQSALENLKATREVLSTSVRALTGEEQSPEMLGAEDPEMGDVAEPDAMNPDDAGDGMDMDDEFGAADAAAGGAEEMGRTQRESIDRGSRLLKVLAG